MRREHIKKESNKSGPGDQEEGKEIAKRGTDRDPTQQWGRLAKGETTQGWHRRQHPGPDIICDYYSLCGVSLALTRASRNVAARVRIVYTYIDKPRETLRGQTYVELQIVRRSARVGKSREPQGRGRHISIGNSEERRTAKNRRNFAYARPNCTLPMLFHHRIRLFSPSSRPFPAS